MTDADGVLVTGAAGLVGRALVERLLQEGRWRVVGKAEIEHWLAAQAQGPRTLVLRLPPRLLRAALRVAHALRLSGYSAGLVDFLAYRPVLDNTQLKTVFRYRPRHDSRATFTAWCRDRPATRI